MAMYERIVLCGCSAYEEKYYLDKRFLRLPEAVKEELKILCVMHTTQVGGILTMEFDEEGSLILLACAKEDDLLYDEIGSGLKIKQMREEHKELFEALELYYRAFIRKEDISKLLSEDE